MKPAFLASAHRFLRCLVSRFVSAFSSSPATANGVDTAQVALCASGLLWSAGAVLRSVLLPLLSIRTQQRRSWSHGPWSWLLPIVHELLPLLQHGMPCSHRSAARASTNLLVARNLHRPDNNVLLPLLRDRSGGARARVQATCANASAYVRLASSRVIARMSRRISFHGCKTETFHTK